MVTTYDTYGTTQQLTTAEVACVIARATGQSVAAVRETLERAR